MTARVLMTWIAVNLLILAGHPAIGGAVGVHPILTSLLVNALLFVLPGIGWEAVITRPARGLGMRLIRVVLLSTGVFFASLLTIYLIKVPLTAASAWLAIAILTNVGFVWAAFRRRPAPDRRSRFTREAVIGGVVFLLCYGLYFWGATRVVPPQMDHDTEVQATAVPLLKRFEPLLFTDRGTIYYFAHPPLLHFYVGGSFLLHGKLDDLQFYDEVSRRGRDERKGRPVPPPEGRMFLWGRDGPLRILGADGPGYYLVEPEKGGPTERMPADVAEFGKIYQRYLDAPYLVETRTPNIFFGAATVALLAMWIGRISRRWWLGLLIAAGYATSPEIFVRSSYGGYFAIGGFAIMLILLAASRRRRPGMPLVTGAFAAVADHKLVILPAAIALDAATGWYRAWRARERPRFLALLHPTMVGFLIGTGVFWLWGMWIGPWDFVRDHLVNHLIDRITHQNPLGYGGYPSPVGLWTEFIRHTGYVVLPCAVLLLIFEVVRPDPRSRSGLIHARRSWLLYFAFSAAAFTLVDWRMTKHLAPLLLPLHLALAPERAAARWRIALPVAVMLIALAVNVSAIMQLVRDFDGFVLAPAW